MPILGSSGNFGTVEVSRVAETTDTALRPLHSQIQNFPLNIGEPLPHETALARGRTLEQQLALARVAGERRGSLQLGACFIVPAELREQVAAYARQQVISLERRLIGELVDELESGGRTERHRNGHGAIELDDRRRRELGKRRI